MDFGRLQELLGNMNGRGAVAADTPVPDTAEKIQISSLSLLKMLKHGLCIFYRKYLSFMYLSFVYRKSGNSYGGYGIDAWPICGRIYNHLC